jgi:dihydrodipicolinate synthase/N-acetylneuraminate lyase
MKKYRRNYEAANPEKVREMRRKYLAANHEKLREQGRDRARFTRAANRLGLPHLLYAAMKIRERFHSQEKSHDQDRT